MHPRRRLAAPVNFYQTLTAGVRKLIQDRSQMGASTMPKTGTMAWAVALGLSALAGCDQVWGPFIQRMSTAGDMPGAVDMAARDMRPLSTPVITQLTPSSGPTVGKTPLVITGRDFLFGATVTVGGQKLAGALFS